MPYEGNGEDGKHYWLTPPMLMAELQGEFGFDFDPCPYPRPEGFDGLQVEWGKSNYVNPPFKGPTAWVRKAIAEHRQGKRVVLVFPIDKWIHLLLEAGARVRNLRDVRWCAIEDGAPGKGTGRHIAAFVLEPEGEAMAEITEENAITATACVIGDVPCVEIKGPGMEHTISRREAYRLAHALLEAVEDAEKMLGEMLAFYGGPEPRRG